MSNAFAPLAVDPDGKLVPLQLDVHGALLISSASGGTAMPDGYLPTAVDPDGKLVPMRVDVSGALIVAGGSGSGGAIDLPGDSRTQADWRMGEDVGATVFANSGVGGAGLTLGGAVGNVQPGVVGIAGRALELSGLRSYVLGAPTLRPATALTLSMWVNFTAFGNDVPMIARAFRTDNSWASPFTSAKIGLVATFGTDGVFAGEIAIAGARVPVVCTKNLTLNKWQHVAMTFDGLNIRLWLDGMAVGSGAAVGVVDYSSGAAEPWAVGGWRSTAATGSGFSGRLRRPRIDDLALTQAQLLSIVRAANGIA
jgi:hypothetical protein